MMEKTGRWSLSPSYDNVYTNDKGWFSKGHQITISGKSINITLEDVMALGRQVGLRKDKCREAIDQIREAISEWRFLSDEHGLTLKFESYVDEVEEGLDAVDFNIS